MPSLPLLELGPNLWTGESSTCFRQLLGSLQENDIRSTRLMAADFLKVESVIKQGNT